jgi:O-antigen/teichoic acid export membrane protein
MIYRQTSLLLLIAGLFLLLEVAVNFPDLCAFISNETLLGAYWPVLILGTGRIVDMGTSINGHIIQYSEKYRVNVYFIVFLGAINIGLNLLFIPRYGMIGAASATAFSLIAYNLLRTVYVHFQFGMLPFSWKTVGVVLIAGLSLAVGLILPDTSSPLLNLVYRGALVAGLFLGLIYYWQLSPQFNETLDGTWNRIKKWWRG